MNGEALGHCFSSVQGGGACYEVSAFSECSSHGSWQLSPQWVCEMEYLELATAAAEREESEEQDTVRCQPNILRQRINPTVFYDGTKFDQRFRLSKRTVAYVVDLIEANIRPDTDKNAASSPVLQVLIADKLSLFC